MDLIIKRARIKSAKARKRAEKKEGYQFLLDLFLEYRDLAPPMQKGTDIPRTLELRGRAHRGNYHHHHYAARYR